MTEAEWLVSSDYLAMLIHLRGDVAAVVNESGAMPGLHCHAGYLATGQAERTTRRKLRLFAAAISQKWNLIRLDELSRTLLEAYQKFANDEATYEQFWDAGLVVRTAVQEGARPTISHMATLWQDTPFGVASLGSSMAWAIADHTAKESVAVTCKDGTKDDWFAWGFGGPPDPLWQATRSEIEADYPHFLREVIGNPFRRVMLERTILEWNDNTIPHLALAIHDDRAFEQLPILADALEEAGCTSADLLAHCRGSRPHVRGCWAVDLILGME